MISKFNDSLDQQWREHFIPNLKDPIQKLAPNYYNNTLKKNALLFIGFNPSFRKADEYLQSDLLWNNGIVNREKVCKIDLNSRNSHPFFTALKTFAKEIHELGIISDGKEWEHIDLFNFRHTKQKEAKKFLSENKNFKNSQLNNFKNVFTYLKPQMVVIPSAGASDVFLTEIMKNRVENDNAKSLYHYDNTPIFCASMLSGKRTIDRFSRTRLIESIKRELT